MGQRIAETTRPDSPSEDETNETATDTDVPSIAEYQWVSIIIGYRTLGDLGRRGWRMHGSLFDGMYRTVVMRPILAPADGTDRTDRLRALMGSMSMVYR